MKKVFTIECKDIVLREFQAEDLEELYALTLQPEITDFLPDWKSTKEQRKNWLVKYNIKENKDFFEAVPNTNGYCLRLGIILKETNEFIGWCCSGIKDELPYPNREIAYAISKNHRSKGYTTQAAQALIKYLFDKTDVEVLNAIALPHNFASNKVIQKCGFNYIGDIEVEGQQFKYYKLNKNEYK